MKTATLLDLLLNVLLPLVLGTALYLGEGLFSSIPFLKNHLADGLWAYAFASSLLIIWDRVIHPFWFSFAIAVCIAFECLQATGLITGTGDIYDVLTYLTAMMLAMGTNRYFKNLNTNTAI